MAAINALSVIKNTPGFSERPVIVNIDSQYVKNGITTWIKSWLISLCTVDFEILNFAAASLTVHFLSSM